MEHVGIVVDDLAAATAFFVELGLKLQGEGPVEGGWVDRVVGLEGVRAEIAMVETPDGHGRLELTKFHAPSGRGGDRHAPANTPGIRHVAFAVDVAVDHWRARSATDESNVDVVQAVGRPPEERRAGVGLADEVSSTRSSSSTLMRVLLGDGIRFFGRKGASVGLEALGVTHSGQAVILRFCPA